VSKEEPNNVCCAGNGLKVMDGFLSIDTDLTKLLHKFVLPLI
jgi:hypothetical protein